MLQSAGVSWEKSCFQNKSKFITEEYFTKHINIKAKWKHKLITKAINLIKLLGWRDLLSVINWVDEKIIKC